MNHTVSRYITGPCCISMLLVLIDKIQTLCFIYLLVYLELLQCNLTTIQARYKNSTLYDAIDTASNLTFCFYFCLLLPLPYITFIIYLCFVPTHRTAHRLFSVTLDREWEIIHYGPLPAQQQRRVCLFFGTW